MKKTFWAVAGGFLFLSLIALQGFAQSEAKGPFEFQVDLRGEYTDNRDSSPDKESNLDLFIQPRVDVDHESEATLIDLYYAPAYRWRDNPGETQNDTELLHELAIRAEHAPVPRLKLRGNEMYYYTDDPAVTKGGTTMRRDSSYSLNRLEGGVNYEISPRKNVDVAGRWQMKWYDDEDVAMELDEDHLGSGLTFWNQFQRTMGGLAGVDYGLYDYNSSVDAGYGAQGAIDRDFDLLTGLVGIEKMLNKTLRVGGRVGYQQASYSDDRISNMSEPYGNITISGNTIPALKLLATITHGMRDSNVYPFASQDCTESDGRAEYELQGPLTLVGILTYRNSRYDTDVVPENVDPIYVQYAAKDGSEDTIMARGEIHYQINAMTMARLWQMYETVDSDVTDNFDRNTTGLALSRKF